jgi:hypothetical protein
MPEQGGNGLLDELQQLLAQLSDAPVQAQVSDFHIAERAQCATLMQRDLAPDEDEQVLVCDEEGGVALSVYVDAQVLCRLGQCNPLHALNESNLADFCTALEGVSHFHYLVWSAQHRRQVSLLELELQAEVDKYAVAMYLLRQQGREELQLGLCSRLFGAVSYMLTLSAETLQRYHEANRCAARYCLRLERHLLRGHFRPEAWLRSLREFYRLSQHAKLRAALA